MARSEAVTRSDRLPSLQCWPDSPPHRSLASLPVGGRLAHFSGRWQALHAHPWIVELLRRGYKLEFLSKPPLTNHPDLQSASGDPTRTQTLREISTDLLDKAAIERVVDTSSPGFYSRLFFVPKKSGGVRPVIDLSTLNSFLVVPKFKMESVHSIRASLRLNAWAYSLDLRDAYFHIPVHRASRKYLRFQLEGEVFQFRALPFGLSTAPLIFTKVVTEVKRFCHERGLCLFQYLDDWLGEAPSQTQAQEESARLVALCEHLGLIINMPKSDLQPKQAFSFLGALFDFQQGLIRPTRDSLQSIQSWVSRFRSLSSASAHSWQCLLGILAAQEKFIPLGRLHMRPLQWHLQDHWCQASQPPNTEVPITADIKAQLLWWTVPDNILRGAPLRFPEPNIRIFTDASTQGWGAHMDGSTIQGTWSRTEQLLHINVLEMRAVRLALERLEVPPHSRVLVASDNTTVVAYVNKQGGTHSRQLWLETSLLFELLSRLQSSLRARHIPGRLNVIADQLSREGQILPTEWSLRQDIVDSIFATWGHPHIDLFATRYNHKCPVFVSPVPDPLALEADALSISWEAMSAYAFPPHQILTAALNQFRKTRSCRLILVAPRWPNQAWFPTLLQLTQVAPIELPTSRTMLKQPHSSMFHNDPGSLNLHAWLLVRDP